MSQNSPSRIYCESPLADFIDNVIRKIATILAWLNVILVGVILLQVTLRYGFSHGLIVLEELQWQLYAAAVMFGLSYAQVRNSHVRVDVLHPKMPAKLIASIEVFGIVFLLAPFLFVVIDHGYDFFMASYERNESSASPAGLPYLWIIKSVIPVSFSLLALASFSSLVRAVTFLFRKQGGNQHAV